MNWRRDLRGVRPGLALRPGCSDADLAGAEAKLGVSIPWELASFLRATDGLYDPESQCAYGWDLATLTAENSRAWSAADAALPRTLLAFGTDGAGGWFCVPLAPDAEAAVLHWNWIDGEARVVAPDLRSFWLGWLSGALAV